jgi:hypothetical protein
MNLRRLSLAVTMTLGISALTVGASCASVVSLNGGLANPPGKATGPTTLSSTILRSVAPGVPEPSEWLMLILGVGVVGLSVRARQRAVAPASTENA